MKLLPRERGGRKAYDKAPGKRQPFNSRFDKSPTISHTRVHFFFLALPLALIVKTANKKKVCLKRGRTQPNRTEQPVGNWWQLLFIDIRPKPPWKHFKIFVKHKNKSQRRAGEEWKGMAKPQQQIRIIFHTNFRLFSCRIFKSCLFRFI